MRFGKGWELRLFLVIGHNVNTNYFLRNIKDVVLCCLQEQFGLYCIYFVFSSYLKPLLDKLCVK